MKILKCSFGKETGLGLPIKHRGSGLGGPCSGVFLFSYRSFLPPCYLRISMAVASVYRMKILNWDDPHCTVIRFVSTRAKFSICAVVLLNGTLVEDRKSIHSRLNVSILASTSVPFLLMTLQVSNLALTDTKRITLC